MAFTGILTTISGIDLMSGANINATGATEDSKNILTAMAEQYLALIGNYDFVANVGSLTALGKEVLSEYCARSVAMSLVAYDGTAISTATSLIEAENRMTIHLYRMQLIEKLISDQNYVKRITGT